MTRTRIVILACVCGAFAAGCNSAMPGTTRRFGSVGYDQVFSAARDVMGQYFSLEKVDRGRGLMRSRPRLVEAGRHGLVRRSPARQVATLRVRRDGPHVVVLVSVAVQQRSSAAYRIMQSDEENYSGVPNRTPAEIDAATTPEQNQAWQAVRYDHSLERTILDQIGAALRAARQPASAPSQ